MRRGAYGAGDDAVKGRCGYCGREIGWCHSCWDSSARLARQATERLIESLGGGWSAPLSLLLDQAVLDEECAVERDEVMA